MRNAVIGVAVAIAAGMPAVSVAAHAFLTQAVPPVGVIVSAPPPQLRLRFSEAIEPAFSKVELATAEGQPIQTGPATVDGAVAEVVELGGGVISGLFNEP